MNYYAFHLGDYLSRTAHLDPMEDIAYRRLMDCYYLDEKPLPRDVEECARRTRLRGHEAIVAAVLREFFEDTPDGWRHARCEAEIEAAQSKRAKAQQSAAQRWDSERNATAVRTQCDRNAPNPNPNPIEEIKKEEKKERSPTGSRLPADFPDGELLTWAARERPDLDIRSTAAKFRDYWCGIPGARGRKLDWPATWRLWVRGEKPQARASPQDRRSAVAAALGTRRPPEDYIDVIATTTARLG